MKRFLVMADKIARNLLPANFCSPSLIIFIPYRNRANEPISFKKSKKVYSISNKKRNLAGKYKTKKTSFKEL